MRDMTVLSLTLCVRDDSAWQTMMHFIIFDILLYVNEGKRRVKKTRLHTYTYTYIQTYIYTWQTVASLISAVTLGMNSKTLALTIWGITSIILLMYLLLPYMRNFIFSSNLNFNFTRSLCASILLTLNLLIYISICLLLCVSVCRFVVLGNFSARRPMHISQHGSSCFSVMRRFCHNPPSYQPSYILV